jgi:hypothetical protein
MRVRGPALCEWYGSLAAHKGRGGCDVTRVMDNRAHFIILESII